MDESPIEHFLWTTHAVDRIRKKHPWGLIDRDRETGKLMGFEIWNASSVLPREMIDALRSSSKPSGVAA
jgi:hypothetical protein